jgi:hypothetical protein
VNHIHKAALGLVAFVVALAGLAAPSSASNHLPPHRWETPHTVCVHSKMGSGWTSPRSAAEALDAAIWYWNIEFRPSTSSCDGFNQVITINRVDDPNAIRAWTNKSTITKTGTDGKLFGAFNVVRVYINTNEKFSDRTWAQNRRTLMHELMHGMITPRGPEWTGGHTSRCDSILTDSYSCLQRLDDLTAYDKQTVRDVYFPTWNPF